MAAKKFNCPKCQAVLTTPDEPGEIRLRCPACAYVFRVRIPPRPSVDEMVVNWLSEDEQEDAAPPTDRLAPVQNPAPAAGPPPATAEAKTPAPADASAEATGEAEAEAEADALAKDLEAFRVVSVERRGALFEFPADCLRHDSLD